MKQRERAPGEEKPEAAVPVRRHGRLESLPWSVPKPADEDPDAPERLRRIMTSPSFRQADQDIDFLGWDDTRAVRLQLDFLKPEVLLQRHDVRHTIVVFGSTRIPEPAGARRKVQQLRDAVAKEPASSELQLKLARAERVLAKSRYYDMAREFGRLVGNSGGGPEDSRLVVMTGGGPGMMEAANRGAYDSGAKSIGLNISLPHEQYPNPYITPDLCFQFHYFALRKLHFLLRAKALVAFPGGYGTFDELFETLTLIQTCKIKPAPVVLVGESFWRRAFDIDYLIDEGVVDPEDRDLFWYAESAREIWDGIVAWYEANGESLLDDAS